MAVIKESIGDKVFDIINLILLTIVLVIILYPLIFIISASISDAGLVNTGKIILLPRGLNIEGYRRIFRDPNIMISYVNTIYYTVVGTLISLALTLPAAYSLSKKHLFGGKTVMFLMAFTMYFSGGMIPTYLIIKGLNLYDTRTVLLVISAVNTYNLIIARTFFTHGIPVELEEAARIDGCTQARTFFAIVLPLSKALIGVMALYYGVAQWNSFMSALIYISDRKKAPLQLVLRDIFMAEMLSQEMVEQAMSEEEQALKLQLSTLIKYAMIVVSSVPVMIAYPFLQKYFDKGVMLGSLKG